MALIADAAWPQTSCSGAGRRCDPGVSGSCAAETTKQSWAGWSPADIERVREMAGVLLAGGAKHLNLYGGVTGSIERSRVPVNH